jgi:hypothetical protein
MNLVIHLIESFGEVRDRLSFLLLQRSKFSHIIYVILSISPLSQENIIQSLNSSNRSRSQSPEPFSNLTIQALDEDSHPDILILNIEVIFITVKSIQVLFSSYVPFPSELGHILQVVSSRERIHRMG